MPKKKIPQDRLVEPVGTLRVKFKDVFGLKDFYEFLHEWLLEHEWHDDEEGVGSDHWETYHFERIAAGNVKEIYLQWRVAKQAKDGKFKYYLDLNWHCIGFTLAEVVKDGHKLKIDKGDMEIEIFPCLEKVYETYFDERPFLRPFKKLFSTRIYGEVVEYRKKELYQETYALQNAIKQWLKMERYLPYEEPKAFYPSRSYPSHKME